MPIGNNIQIHSNWPKESSLGQLLVLNEFAARTSHASPFLHTLYAMLPVLLAGMKKKWLFCNILHKK